MDDLSEQQNMMIECDPLQDAVENSKPEKCISTCKVLLLNGSPHTNGCTSTALNEMIKIFDLENIETEMIHVGSMDIKECIACDKCTELNKCYFDDVVNELAYKFEASAGIVVGSPVYYASPTGVIMSVMNRLFYSTHFSKQMKIGASVICGGRGDNTSAFDMLNKYFYISGMPIASATYCNQVHGTYKDDGTLYISGLHTTRNLARNMSFMIKAFANGRDKFGFPSIEK